MSTSEQRPTAIIIGGGIGGLAAGIALRRIGVEVRIFERSATVGEVGAGLSLWPNGIRALDGLGLGEEVRARSVRDLSGALRTERGQVLVAANGRELERILGDVSLVVHRAELLSLLRRQLPDAAIVTGVGCREVVSTEWQVTASFADGTLQRADMLIGADGIHSVVRDQLFDDGPPLYAGYTAWRAVVSFDHRKLLPGVSIGAGSQFGQVPMADGKVYWFATRNTPPGTRRPDGGWRQQLLRLFENWHQPIPELIAATREEDILHNDILDREPLPRWGSGRVTLLGDAAHPMTPNLGQGANQALEDADALATAVAAHRGAGAGKGKGNGHELEAGLRAYEEKRTARANALILKSRRVGQVMQLENRIACWARNALLGTRAATRMQMAQLKELVTP